jgi:hypothetical protein
MSIVSPYTFGPYNDVPEAHLVPEWHALVSQQGRALAGMLHHIQTAVAGVQHRTDPLSNKAVRPEALAADTEQLLAMQAQQHVRLACELAQLRTLVPDLRQASTEAVQRVQGPGCLGYEVVQSDKAALRTQRPLQRRDR